MILALLWGCGPASPVGTEPAVGTPSIYADLSNWLCHPDDPESACDTDLDVTVVHPDGRTELEPFEPAVAPSFDCFYVYPTISADPTVQSDLVPGPEEIFTAQLQFARYGQVCRTFAPMYRQMTVAGLFGGADREEMFAAAYVDVLDAWNHYLEHESDGRDVLLVGHSQGARLLIELLASEIESDDAVYARVRGAHLIGMRLSVPDGERVGGDLSRMPVCETPDERGCVTAYMSFREDDPPGEDLFVGQPDPGDVFACASPSDSGVLSPVFTTAPATAATDLLAGTTQPWSDPSAHEAISTPFFRMPGLVTAECARSGDVEYLSIGVASDPADVRVDDIDGDFFLPGWGLHFVDVHLAMDDLVQRAGN